MRKLNNRGKILVGVFFLVCFIGFIAILDKIRFEFDENKSEENFQLLINGEIINPSRVISKANFVFDHYDDEEIAVSVPINSEIKLNNNYEIKNSNGEVIKEEVTYLPDGKYTISVKEGTFKYTYKLNVDNDFFAELDMFHARQGGLIVANFHDLNEGEVVSVEATFPTSSKIEKGSVNIPIPIDYDATAGLNNIVFKTKKSSQSFDFELGETAHKTYYMTIDGYEKKVEEESEELTKLNKALSKISKTNLATNYVVPSTGYISSNFGDKLYINNDADPTVINYAIDYSDVVGSHIVATTSGKVTYVGEFEVYGKVVIIDHGRGVVSSYYHLNEIDVNVGDIVDAGTLIAKMGKTGNVSGSHVNFQIQINGIRVDPNIFLSGNVNF